MPVRSSGAYGDFGRARRLGSLRNGRAGQIHRGAYCDAPSERWRPVVFARDPVCRRHERSPAPLDLPVPGREAARSKAASSLVLGRTLAAGERSSLPNGDDSRAGAKWRRLNRKSCVPRRANNSARRVKSNNRRSRTQGCRPRGTGGFSETVSDPFLGTSPARGRSREQAANNSVNADSSACHEAASTEREEEGERVMFLLDLQQEGRDFQQCRRTRALPSRSFLVAPRSGTCLASELS